MKQPLAIAMWDFSWLLRHHRGGEFEDWDRVLDGLAERGYNAIRIDCFPHLIAADAEGKMAESFHHPKNDWAPALWGNQYSIHSRPREALLEFLPKCKERGIYVGLASWFAPHGTNRNAAFQGVKGFVRAWDETLEFLAENRLLDNVIYVDLLNEYPLWHGFDWLKDEMNALHEEGDVLKSKQEAHIQEAETDSSHKKKFNPAQEAFYRNFMSEALRRLKAKWSDLDMFASQSNSRNVPWNEMDFSEFSSLDVHLWFVHHDLFHDSTSYYQNIHSPQNDVGFEKAYKEIMNCWREHREPLIQWMNNAIKNRADMAREYGLACGNTEGWGPINWSEHRTLDWDFAKEAGDICVDLALEHGFGFICTSNFTHPQFPGIWNDVKWHRNLTQRIRSSTLKN